MNILSYYQINYNERLNPILHSFSTIKKHANTETLQRIFKVSLPLLNLYQPTAMASTIGLNAINCTYILKDCVISIKNKNGLDVGKHLLHLTFVTSTVALSILLPRVTGIATHSFQIAKSIINVLVNLKAGKPKEAFKEMLHIINESIYLASIIYAAPEIILLSLLAQATTELYRASKEFRKKGHIFEGIANLITALIRLSQAVSQGKTLHRNYFGKELTDDNIQSIMTSIEEERNQHPDHFVDFEKILIKHYYSSKIRNITNGFTSADLSKVIFKNLTFSNCEISRCNFNASLFNRVHWVKSTIMSSLFENATFNSCSFSHSILSTCRINHALFNHTTFSNTTVDASNFFRTFFLNSTLINSKLRDSNLAETELKNVTFERTNLEKSCFNDASMNSVKFFDVKLNQTNFLGTQAKNSLFKNSDLTNCLLVDAKEQFSYQNCSENVMTHPVIGLLWNFSEIGSYTSLINKALMDCGALVLKFDYRRKGGNISQLERDVKLGLKKISTLETPIEGASITENLLKSVSEGSELEKYTIKGKMIAAHIDGLVIPGGFDIQPEFYGAEMTSAVYTDSNYERSITEFAVLAGAIGKGIPIQGICRGSQLVNVFLGGTLKQNVANHYSEAHYLKVNDNSQDDGSQIIKDLIGEGAHCLSMHHQASDKIGNGLKVVLEHEGTPEALVSQDGNIVLTQFHPEAYLFGKLTSSDLGHPPISPDETVITYSFNEGKNFFKRLIERAKIQSL